MQSSKKFPNVYFPVTGTDTTTSVVMFMAILSFILGAHLIWSAFTDGSEALGTVVLVTLGGLSLIVADVFLNFLKLSERGRHSKVERYYTAIENLGYHVPEPFVDDPNNLIGLATEKGGFIVNPIQGSVTILNDDKNDKIATFKARQVQITPYGGELVVYAPGEFRDGMTLTANNPKLLNAVLDAFDRANGKEHKPIR